MTVDNNLPKIIENFNTKQNKSIQINISSKVITTSKLKDICLSLKKNKNNFKVNTTFKHWINGCENNIKFEECVYTTGKKDIAMMVHNINIAYKLISMISGVKGVH